jgi:hypothetical protein
MKAGLSLVAAAAASAMLVTPAFASSATAASFGQYTTWKSAQHAAGFQLKYPRSTYGLTRNGKIGVGPCLVSGKLKDKVVDVQYGSFTKHAIGLEQDNAGVACTVGSGGSSLGSYKVGGATAYLHGYCGNGTGYSCASSKIELWLNWRKGRDYYVVSSFNESRSRLVSVARNLKKA